MKKYEKEVQQAYLDSEKAVLKQLEKNYEDALAEINDKIAILLGRQDADQQYVIYQVEFQKSLKKQIEAILETLHSNEFETVSEYLTKSYEDGYIGAMYSMQMQGIPLVMPIDQEQVLEAIQHETKLSENLYTALGKDIKDLQKKIAGEISRGIAGGQMYSEIARNVSNWARIPRNNAMRIARTEAHRIQCKATADAQKKAKAKGADVVKQWDASLDGKTRPHHRQLDGQIRELEEPFEIGGHKAMQPGDFNIASEDINCRCALLQRARWALGNDYTKWSPDAPVLVDDDGTTQFTIIEAKNFEDFQKKFKQAVQDLQGGMKLEFPDDVFKVNGITENVKKELDRALKKLESEYNIKLHGIYIEPAKKGDIFVTGYHYKVVDMVVNENADFDKIIASMQKKYASGYYAGKTLEDYLAHEMAHCMLYQDCKTDDEFHAKYQQIEALYDKLKGISGYADEKKSGNEALAEAFVRVRNNEEVSPIAKTLVKSYFGKWKK